jgi:hypothetical protein
LGLCSATLLGDPEVSRMTDENPYLVHKREVPIRVTLSTGEVVDGTVHCNVRAVQHHGRERVKDVLNGEAELVPLLVNGQSVLVHKSFIEQVGR